MIPHSFPELFVSLSLQCSIVLLLASWLASRAASSVVADRIWATSHVLVLTLCLIGFLLPHLRVLQPGFVLLSLSEFAAGSVFQQIFRVIAIIWLTGVVLLAIGVATSLLKTHGIVRRSRVMSSDDSGIEHSGIVRSAEVQETVDLPVPPRIRTSSISWSPAACDLLQELKATVVCSREVVTPFCWQLHSPVIVLPEAMLSFPVVELDAVLRHELAHLKAQHPLRLFLQRLLEIGFWFHPLVWWSSREASLQRELASDLMANQSASQAAIFLRGMVRLAEYCTARTRGMVAGMNFGGSGQSMIQRRVDQLLALDWSARRTSQVTSSPSRVLVLVAIACALIWVPLNPDATGRTIFSPWPSVTASVLHEAGVNVRDYEVDTHRLHEHVFGRNP